MARAAGEVSFSAPYVLEYTYRRSVGPVIGRFFAGLRERAVVGVRTRAGRVLVPPSSTTRRPARRRPTIVEVGPAGVVTTWAWVTTPRPKHPLARPFAWALVQLDGADTAMLHAVDAGIRRAHAHRHARRGALARRARRRHPRHRVLRAGGGAMSEQEPVKSIVTPVAARVHRHGGARASRASCAGSRSGRILGQRCPECRKVYVPPRGACPTCGVATAEEVEVAGKGTVTTFCIVNIPFDAHPPEAALRRAPTSCSTAPTSRSST